MYHSGSGGSTRKKGKQPVSESSYERSLAEGQRELRRLGERVPEPGEEQFLWNAQEAVTLTGAEAQEQMSKELMELTGANTIEEACAILLENSREDETA
jgi:hypothetical protein